MRNGQRSVGARALRATGALAVLVLQGFGGCATTEVTPPPGLPEVPNYVKVPHPQGYDLADVRALFHAKDAPTHEELKDCDAAFRKLEKLSSGIEELAQGAREIANLDPVGQHWCFYWSLIELHDYVKENVFWNERKQRVMDTYAYLVPMGKAFQNEFQEPRYLQWATRHYRQMSEWVFYRRLEIGAESEVNWTDKVVNPFAHYRQPVDLNREPAQAPVLEKYGIIQQRSEAGLGGAGEAVPVTPPAGAPVTAPLSAPGTAVPTDAAAAAPVPGAITQAGQGATAPDAITQAGQGSTAPGIILQAGQGSAPAGELRSSDPASAAAGTIISTPSSSAVDVRSAGGQVQAPLAGATGPGAPAGTPGEIRMSDPSARGEVFRSPANTPTEIRQAAPQAPGAIPMAPQQVAPGAGTSAPAAPTDSAVRPKAVESGAFVRSNQPTFAPGPEAARQPAAESVQEEPEERGIEISGVQAGGTPVAQPGATAPEQAPAEPEDSSVEMFFNGSDLAPVE